MKRFRSHSKSIKSTDGFSIYYEVDYPKHKKMLVLLHALGGDLTSWKKERDLLNSYGYGTLAVDLRGHGLSDRPGSMHAYNFTNFADDIHAIVKQEELIDPIVVGHCLGGMIALVMEGTTPKRFRSIVLVSTSYKAPLLAKTLAHHALLNKILTLVIEKVPNIQIPGHIDFTKMTNTPDWDFRRFLTDFLHTSMKSYLLICEQIIGFNATTLLYKIEVPTLIIEGKQDSIFPPSVAKYIAKRIRRAHVDMIEGNHIIILNNPKDLAADIQKFVGRLKF